VGQVVVEDGVGLLQDAAALDGEELRISGAGADEVDLQWHKALPCASERSSDLGAQSPPCCRSTRTTARRVRRLAIGFRADYPAAVGSGYDGKKAYVAFGHGGVSADGYLATAAERREYGAFGHYGGVRFGVIQQGHLLEAGPRFNGQRALPDGGT